MNYAGAPITSYARLREVVDAQMEADSCLPAGSIHSAREHGSVLLSSARLELEQMATHRRIFRDHFELRLANYRGLTLLCPPHPRVLEEIEALLSGDGGNWMGDYSKLREINNFLTPYALQSSGTALYYTPSRTMVENPKTFQLPREFVLVHLAKDEWNAQRASQNFTNALGTSELRPDVLVSAIEHNGEVVAMAGASADSAMMYQIGIDVLPAYRSKGLGTALVAELSRRVLEAGKVPFYGTSPSHIQSQVLAERAGYEPAWWEFVSSSLLEVTVD